MLRLTEIGLFLLPFALLVAWRVLGTLSRSVLVTAGMLFAGLTVSALWLGLTGRLAPGETYVPAHLEGGRIISGHTETQ